MPFNEDAGSPKLGRWEDVNEHGVGVEWLAGAWGMDRRKVRAKLAGVAPVGHVKKGNTTYPRYRLREAAAYLSPSVEGLTHALKNMKSSDLPPELQDAVWSARLKEAKWRELAGELWPTESVLEVLGDTFQTIKTSMQLWADQIERERDLPSDARAHIIRLVDALQSDIHKRLVEMPRLKQTPSAAAEIPKAEDADG